MDIFLSWATIIIPSLVTVVGLRISYTQNKKNFEDEIKKNQKNFMIDKTFEVLDDIMKVIFNDTTLKHKLTAKDTKQKEDMSKLIVKVIGGVYKCGSKDAIKILSTWQQYNYSSDEKKEKYHAHYSVILYFLLISQLKYDVTGEIICPLEGIKVKINDYETNPIMKEDIPKLINQTIDDLRLNDEFKVKR